LKRRGKLLRADVLLREVLDGHPSFAANPIGNWQDLVGEQVARYTQPKSLKKKVLVVSAYDSIWKHHLELNKDILAQAINRGRKEPLVEKIVVRVEEVPESMPVLNPSHRLLERIKPKRRPQKGSKKKAVRPLSPEEKALLAKISDPDLRTIGSRLLKRLSDDADPSS